MIRLLFQLPPFRGRKGPTRHGIAIHFDILQQDDPLAYICSTYHIWAAKRISARLTRRGIF
jgi:hypothetical protein